ncbi:MAG: hypothetical protein JST30_04965 [Armatimonadetes bacterium]|nr:hypothetical protein [Armatimonadota bacterium]
MKAIMISLAVCACANGFTQGQIVYNNAEANDVGQEGLKTGTRSLGGFWSEVQKGCTVCGFRSANWNGGNDRLADDFTVSNTKWQVTGATLWMYQTNAVVPTVKGGLFEIRKKTAAGGVGALVSTGSFLRAKMSDMFRIHNGQPLDIRWLQQVDVQFDTVLTPGDYYLVWSATGTWPFSGPWTPYLANPGYKTTYGANALQSNNGGAGWYSVQDGLSGQDFPFVFYGQRFISSRGS